ncbi:hypothetical protein [Leisingera sp. S232]|uniref:hypothetical protein n=1 Tax=Leisingera sp. S232 TaxID=3415132 RepID=UPI003C79FE77
MQLLIGSARPVNMERVPHVPPELLPPGFNDLPDYSETDPNPAAKPPPYREAPAKPQDGDG